MKRSLLILCSVAASFLPALRRNLSTANGAADDILEKLGLSTDATPAEIETARIRLIDAANAGATSAGDVLALGGLQLPPGLDKKDVLWRRRAGLSTKHAVAAALAQKQHDDRVGKEKAAKAKQPAVASTVLAGSGNAEPPDFASMTVAELLSYAGTAKIDLAGATVKKDILAAITAFNKQLSKVERQAS